MQANKLTATKTVQKHKTIFIHKTQLSYNKNKVEYQNNWIFLQSS